MVKTYDQCRNAQVIKMRRDNALVAINSLRHYRQNAEFYSKFDILNVTFKVRELIALYRQTNKVLCKNI